MAADVKPTAPLGIVTDDEPVTLSLHAMNNIVKALEQAESENRYLRLVVSVKLAEMEKRLQSLADAQDRTAQQVTALNMENA